MIAGVWSPRSPDQCRDEIVRVAEDHPGGVVNPAMAGHIANVGAAVAARGAPSADCTRLSRLINRTPVSLREFVRANRAVLSVAQTLDNCGQGYGAG
jgi:hypothetical protein